MDKDINKINIKEIDTNRQKRKENKISMSQSQSMSNVVDAAGSGPDQSLKVEDFQNTLRVGAEQKKPKRIQEVDPYEHI